MVERTRIDFNLDGLNDILQKMGSDFVTRVGILGSDVQRDGETTNSEIGLTHEFGSISGNVPARSFLRFPLQLKAKKIIKSLSSKKSRADFENGNYEQIYTRLGIAAEAIVQEAFETGGFGQWPELSPITIAKKGSSAKLIDSGELRKTITSDVVRKSKVR